MASYPTRSVASLPGYICCENGRTVISKYCIVLFVTGLIIFLEIVLVNLPFSFPFSFVLPFRPLLAAAIFTYIFGDANGGIGRAYW